MLGIASMKKLFGYVTVEPVLFLYMMLIFMETTALQGLTFVKVCVDVNHPNDTNDCNKNETSGHSDIVHKATMWSKYCSACLFLCTLLVSFYVGSWSDYFGRKVTMLIPPVGSLIAAAINTALAVFFKVHVAYFLVSASISGLTFGTVGIITSTFGYISDITSEQSRTRRIVILEAMIFTGGTVGSSVAAFILKNNDFHILFNKYSQVFLLEMAVALFITVYIFFRIPSRCVLDAAEKSTIHSRVCCQMFDLSHMRNVFHTITRRRDGRKRLHLVLLLVAVIMLYYGSAVQFMLAFLFVKSKPLLWDITKYSNYNAMQFGVEGIALLIGLPLLLHYYHVPDPWVGILGTISRIVGLILFGLSHTDFMVYMCIAAYMLSEYAVPAVRSMLSKIVEKDEKGKIFAVTTILQNISYFTASLILNSIFEASSFFPGLVFELVAFLHIIALIIFCFLYFTREQITAMYEVIDESA